MPGKTSLIVLINIKNTSGRISNNFGVTINRRLQK